MFTLSLLLTACGGGGGGGGTTVGGGGIGGTGGAVGSVSAIGSITVNGVRYSCVGATVTSDDGTADQGTGDNCVGAEAAGRLSVGSVVVVNGTSDSSGNFTASTVKISNSVTGPAVGINVPGLSFTVLNQTVLVDDTTRFEIGGAPSLGTAGLTLLNAQPANTAVEVSGFRNTNGAILATLVETKSISSSEFELKGFAVVTNGAVTIGGVTIALAGQNVPANGACVEAKGSFASNTLTLTQALKSDDDCNGGSLSGNFDQAEVEGVINDFVCATDFSVGSQKVTTTGTTVFEGGTAADLLDGVKVEAEGSMTNGVLIAKKIQIKSNGVRIEGAAETGLSNGSFTILGITVKVVTGTENSLGPISTGTRMRIEGSKSGATQMTAAKITNASGGGGGGTRTELRGPLDADAVSPTFTILGVQVQTTSSTQFNGTSSAQAATDFFTKAKKNKIVKARGTPAANTITNATEVENED